MYNVIEQSSVLIKKENGSNSRTERTIENSDGRGFEAREGGEGTEDSGITPYFRED